MKNIFLTLLCAAAVPLFAAPQAPLTFEQLRCPLTPQQRTSITGAKLVYKITTEGEPEATLTIRSRRPGELRIDAVSAEDAYTACSNGKSGWGYSTQNGFYDLSAAELAEMHLDADFLPIPVDDDPAFAEPVAKGEETVDGVLCRRYETRSLKASELKVTLWVEKSTSLLRKVEAEDADSKTVTALRNYKTIGGVKIATQLYVSDSDGFHRMSLQSATWNPVFADNMFTKPASAEKLRSVQVTKTPATYRSTSVPRRHGTPTEIAELKKKIAKLEIMIQDDENKLAVIEKLIGDDRQHATALASATTPEVRYRSYWSRHGFVVRHTNRSGRRTRRRMINKLNRETEKAMKSYAAINRDLVRLRIQLAEAKAQLEEISGK